MELNDDDLEVTFVGQITRYTPKGDSRPQPSYGLPQPMVDGLTATSQAVTQGHSKKTSPTVKLDGFEKKEHQLNPWLNCVRYSKTVPSPAGSPTSSSLERQPPPSSSSSQSFSEVTLSFVSLAGNEKGEPVTTRELSNQKSKNFSWHVLSSDVVGITCQSVSEPSWLDQSNEAQRTNASFSNMSSQAGTGLTFPSSPILSSTAQSQFAVTTDVVKPQVISSIATSKAFITLPVSSIPVTSIHILNPSSLRTGSSIKGIVIPSPDAVPKINLGGPLLQVPHCQGHFGQIGPGVSSIPNLRLPSAIPHSRPSLTPQVRSESVIVSHVSGHGALRTVVPSTATDFCPSFLHPAVATSGLPLPRVSAPPGVLQEASYVATTLNSTGTGTGLAYPQEQQLLNATSTLFSSPENNGRYYMNVGRTVQLPPPPSPRSQHPRRAIPIQISAPTKPHPTFPTEGFSYERPTKNSFCSEELLRTLPEIEVEKMFPGIATPSTQPRMGTDYGMADLIPISSNSSSMESEMMSLLKSPLGSLGAMSEQTRFMTFYSSNSPESDLLSTDTLLQSQSPNMTAEQNSCADFSSSQRQGMPFQTPFLSYSQAQSAGRSTAINSLLTDAHINESIDKVIKEVTGSEQPTPKDTNVPQTKAKPQKKKVSRRKSTRQASREEGPDSKKIEENGSLVALLSATSTNSVPLPSFSSSFQNSNASNFLPKPNYDSLIANATHFQSEYVSTLTSPTNAQSDLEFLNNPLPSTPSHALHPASVDEGGFPCVAAQKALRHLLNKKVKNEIPPLVPASSFSTSKVVYDWLKAHSEMQHQYEQYNYAESGNIRTEQACPASVPPEQLPSGDVSPPQTPHPRRSSSQKRSYSKQSGSQDQSAQDKAKLAPRRRSSTKKAEAGVGDAKDLPRPSVDESSTPPVKPPRKYNRKKKEPQVDAEGNSVEAVKKMPKPKRTASASNKKATPVDLTTQSQELVGQPSETSSERPPPEIVTPKPKRAYTWRKKKEASELGSNAAKPTAADRKDSNPSTSTATGSRKGGRRGGKLTRGVKDIDIDKLSQELMKTHVEDDVSSASAEQPHPNPHFLPPPSQAPVFQNAPGVKAIQTLERDVGEEAKRMPMLLPAPWMTLAAPSLQSFAEAKSTKSKAAGSRTRKKVQKSTTLSNNGEPLLESTNEEPMVSLSDAKVHIPLVSFGGIAKPKRGYPPHKRVAKLFDMSTEGALPNFCDLFKPVAKNQRKLLPKPEAEGSSKSRSKSPRKGGSSQKPKRSKSKVGIGSVKLPGVVTTFPLSPLEGDRNKEHSSLQPPPLAEKFGIPEELARMYLESANVPAEHMQIQPFAVEPRPASNVDKSMKPSRKKSASEERPRRKYVRKQLKTCSALTSPEEAVLFRTIEEMKCATQAPSTLALGSMPPPFLDKDSMAPSRVIHKIFTPEPTTLKLPHHWQETALSVQPNHGTPPQALQEKEGPPATDSEKTLRESEGRSEKCALKAMSVKISICDGGRPTKFEDPASGKYEALVKPILSLPDLTITKTSADVLSRAHSLDVEDEMLAIERNLERTSLEATMRVEEEAKVIMPRQPGKRVSRRPVKYQDPGSRRRNSDSASPQQSFLKQKNNSQPLVAKTFKNAVRVVANPGYRWTYTEEELCYVFQANSFLVKRSDICLEMEKVTLWRVMYGGPAVTLKAYRPDSRKGSNRWFHICNWPIKGNDTVKVDTDLRAVFLDYIPVYVTRICDSPEISVVKYYRDQRYLPHVSEMYKMEPEWRKPFYNCVQTLVYHAMDTTFLDKVIYRQDLETVTTEVHDLQSGWGDINQIIRTTCYDIISSPRWVTTILFPIMKFPKMVYSAKDCNRKGRCDACYLTMHPPHCPTKLVKFDGMPYHMGNLTPATDPEEESKPSPPLQFCHSCNNILKTFHTLYHTRYSILAAIHFRLELMLKEFPPDAKLDSLSVKEALDADIDWYKTMFLDFLVTLSQALKDIEQLKKPTYVKEPQEKQRDQ